MSENIQKTENNQPEKSTEIDLGELFRMIGRGFTRFFAFLRNTFLFFLDLLIRALIVVRVHIVKFVIVGILSVIIGLFIDSRQTPIYSSDMVVNANYGSARQLYSNIRYYNNLVEERDSIKLARIFDIDQGEANNIVGFFIEPSVTENDIIREYSAFMKDSDTAYIKDNINFLKFKKNIDPLDYKKHKVSLISLRRGVSNLIQDRLITNNIENEFIRKSKDIRIKSLKEEQKKLEERLEVIDTLRVVYNKSILSQSEKTSSAQTSIQMAASNIKTNEIELLGFEDEITKNILQIKEQQELAEEIIEVLNNFSPGSEVKNFYNTFLFKIPTITITLLLIFIMLRELNSYLNRYTQNKRLNA